MRRKENEDSTTLPPLEDFVKLMEGEGEGEGEEKIRSSEKFLSQPNTVFVIHDI